MLLCKMALWFLWGWVGSGHTECLVEELLSIFPSQIRGLSNKKMDEIMKSSRHEHLLGTAACLFAPVGKRRQEVRVGPGSWKRYPEGLVLHTTMGVGCSLGPRSRKGWTLLMSPGDTVLPCPFPRWKIVLLLLAPAKSVTGRD